MAIQVIMAMEKDMVMVTVMVMVMAVEADILKTTAPKRKIVEL